jgi:hypothetical protein
VNETSPVESPRRNVLLLVLVGIAAVLTVLLGIVLLFIAKSPRHFANTPAAKGENMVNLHDFSRTNAISIQLGGDESGAGLTHVLPKDGQTTIESIDGVTARAVHLEPGRTEQYFYFQIDPTFKQQEISRVRIDVEFFDPEPGALLVHYDARDEPNLAKTSSYRDSTRLRLTGSQRWQVATFYTRDDAIFTNRQHDQSDFRLCAITPALYVRRVTVTREAPVPMVEMKFTAVDAETGQPVPNVSLTVNGNGKSGSFRSTDALTDAEGKCLVKHPGPDTVSLTLNARGIDVTPTRIRWQTTNADIIPPEYFFRVTKPITIGGTVLDEMGQPVESAKVLFRDYAFPNTPANPREKFLIHLVSVTTGADGIWEFKNLPPKFRDFSITVSHPEFVDARFITSGTGLGFANMPMAKLTNRTAVIPLRRKIPL